MYGHINMKGLEVLQNKYLVEGFTIDPTSQQSTCDACVQGKQTVRLFPQKAETQSKIPGEHTFSDIWGPHPNMIHWGSEVLHIIHQ